MNSRGQDIQELCRQVMEGLLLDMNPNNNKETCPFCGKGGWNLKGMEEVEHEPTCAYLIAKDLLTNKNLSLSPQKR